MFLVSLFATLIVCHANDLAQISLKKGPWDESLSGIDAPVKWVETIHIGETYRRRLIGSNTLSSSDKSSLLSYHNGLRSAAANGETGTSATNMRQLEWSDSLASLATEWASACVWEHSSNGYGENLAARASSSSSVESLSTLEASIQSWYDEYTVYNYDSNSCSGTCGHYTQVVRAATYQVGCGYSMCECSSLISGWDYDYCLYLVCNYNPGQYSDQPYESGSTASNCPSGTTANSASGLCETGGSSPTPQPATAPTPTPRPTPQPASNPVDVPSSDTYTFTCSGSLCTVEYVHQYYLETLNDYSGEWQIVRDQAVAAANEYLSQGSIYNYYHYEWHSDVSKYYFGFTCTISNTKYDEAVNLYQYVTSASYADAVKAAMNEEIDFEVTEVSATSYAAKSTGGSGGSTAAWYIWIAIGLFVALVIGVVVWSCVAYRRRKGQTEKQDGLLQNDYVAMDEINNENDNYQL